MIKLENKNTEQLQKIQFLHSDLFFKREISWKNYSFYHEAKKKHDAWLETNSKFFSRTDHVTKE